MWVPVTPNRTMQRDVVTGAEFSAAGDTTEIDTTSNPMGGHMLVQNGGVAPYGYYTSSRTFNVGTAGQTLAVWVPPHTTPLNNPGALIKVGNDSSGFGVGLGVSTWDAAGENIVGLFEVVRWVPTSTAIVRTQANLVAFTVNAAGNGTNVYLNGLEVYSDVSGGPNTPSASTGLMGYAVGGSDGRRVWAAASDFFIWNRALSATEHWALYDPATRWDLYWVPGRRVYFDVGAAAFDAALFPRTDFDDLVRRRDTMIPSGRVA